MELTIHTTKNIKLIGKVTEKENIKEDAKDILRFLYCNVSGKTINELERLIDLWNEMPVQEYSGIESFFKWVEDREK